MTQSTNSDAETRPNKSNNQPNWLLVLIFRLLLLGVGGGLALISGIVFAYFYPNPNPKQPLLLKIWERLENKQAIAPADASPTSIKIIPSPASEQTQLVENSNKKSQSPTTPSKLKVTLPSDFLFDQNNSLRPDSHLILDRIIADLRKLPASTVRITAYTDNVGDNQKNQALSVQRAQAVEQYLAEALGNEYKLLTIGEGATNPLVPNDSPTNQKRNRRLEIAVE